MRYLIYSITLGLSLLASSAFAQDLTCWYGNDGRFAGADGGNYTNTPVGEVHQNMAGGGGGPWVYIMGAGTWADGNSCPPLIDLSGVTQSTGGSTSMGQLSCWYAENGQSLGADSGNGNNAPVGQVTQLPAGGYAAWVYVLADGQWTDGNSCPPALDMSGYAGTGSLSDRDPLSCWYAEDGQSMGADNGNPTNAPIRQVVRNNNGTGWVYVLGVGEWTDGNSCPAVLDVGGAAPVTTGGNAPDYSLTPTYGSVALVSGFQPDPYQVGVYAGGNILANQAISDCYAGYIAAAPDYRLQFTAGTYPLTFWSQSTEDTTLVINDPNGNWHCNDDADGFDPAIRFDAPLSGQYDIWVGRYGVAGDYPTATLSITEY